MHSSTEPDRKWTGETVDSVAARLDSIRTFCELLRSRQHAYAAAGNTSADIRYGKALAEAAILLQEISDQAQQVQLAEQPDHDHPSMGVALDGLQTLLRGPALASINKVSVASTVLWWNGVPPGRTAGRFSNLQALLTQP